MKTENSSKNSPPQCKPAPLAKQHKETEDHVGTTIKKLNIAYKKDADSFAETLSNCLHQA